MPLLSEPEIQKPKLSLIEERELEKARRRKEFIFAAVAFIMVLIFTSIQLNQFRSGDALFVIMKDRFLVKPSKRWILTNSKSS